MLQKIINTYDRSLIKAIRSLITSRNLDWFDDLSEPRQQDVLEGIDQLDAGSTVTHEEAKKMFGY